MAFDVLSASSSDGHSDGVVAIDSNGNVAAMLHSINTVYWGTTGIFVDGVSIADPAASPTQQRTLAAIGPGVRVPEPTNPVIVAQDGKPVFASSSTGMGVHEVTLLGLVNLLDYGLTAAAAAAAEQILRPEAGAVSLLDGIAHGANQVVQRGVFPPEVLGAVVRLGQGIKEVPADSTLYWRGFWVGIARDHRSGELQAALPSRAGGLAQGH